MTNVARGPMTVAAHGLGTLMAFVAVAMATVSSVALASSWRNSAPVAGGQKPARKFNITCAFALSKSCQGLNSARASNGQRTTSASKAAVSRPRAAGSCSGAPAAAIALAFALTGSRGA